jgi:hypothetical protein
MNSIHRTGLAIAGAVALLVMAGAVLVQSYMGGGVAQAAADAATPAPADTAAETSNPTAGDPETVYINPVPTPAVITVINTPPPTHRPRRTAPPVIHIVVPGPGGDDDGGGD